MFSRSRSTSSGAKGKPLKARRPSIEITATSASAFLKAEKFENSEQGESLSCSINYGAAAVQGFRAYMQDDYVCKSNLDVKGKSYGYFGVFDGHGEDGHVVSQYCSDNFLKLLLNRKAVKQAKQVSNELLATNIHKTFIKLDEELGQVLGEDGKVQFAYSGTTACVAFVSGEDILFANVGDSRALLCHDGGVVYETRDHNPSDHDEEKRINSGGGKVYTTPSRHKCVLDPAGYSNLSVSRTIGDFSFKPPSKLPPEAQSVTPAPEIHIVPRNKNGDQFLLIASDGVFKSLTSAQVAQFVLRQLEITDDLTKICRNVIDTAYFAADNIPDDTTVVLVVFPSAPSVSQQTIAEEEALDMEARTAIEDQLKDMVTNAEALWVVGNDFNVLQQLVKKLPEKYRIQQRVTFIIEILSRLRTERFETKDDKRKELPVTRENEQDESEKRSKCKERENNGDVATCVSGNESTKDSKLIENKPSNSSNQEEKDGSTSPGVGSIMDYVASCSEDDMCLLPQHQTDTESSSELSGSHHPAVVSMTTRHTAASLQDTGPADVEKAFDLDKLSSAADSDKSVDKKLDKDCTEETATD